MKTPARLKFFSIVTKKIITVYFEDIERAKSWAEARGNENPIITEGIQYDLFKKFIIL